MKKIIEKDDVIKAIEIFEREKPNYTNPRSTYLVYNGIIYSGKQIRRMAYKLVFGEEPGKKELRGGKPTICFFENLEFTTYWTERDVAIPEYEKQIEEMKLKKKTRNKRK